jgi:hypothetical protein
MAHLTVAERMHPVGRIVLRLLIINPNTNGIAMAMTIMTPQPIAVCFRQPQVLSSKAPPRER